MIVASTRATTREIRKLEDDTGDEVLIALLLPQCSSSSLALSPRSASWRTAPSSPGKYGLPAVLEVGHATTLIPDGQRIRVDATNSRVEQLPRRCSTDPTKRTCRYGGDVSAHSLLQPSRGNIQLRPGTTEPNEEHLELGVDFQPTRR